MLELSKNGAQVLNARSVELARDRQVAVRVRSTFCPADEGTLVTCTNHKQRDFTGVAINTNVNCIEINLEKLELGPGRNLRTLPQQRLQTKRRLRALLSDAGINAQIVAPVRPNPFRIPLIVKKTDTITALATLHTAALSNKQICVNTEVASIVLVATEITAKHQVEAMAAMTAHQIPVLAVAMDHQRLTLLVPLAKAAEGIGILHSQFVNARVAA
jgi:aspartokinase